MMFPMQMAETTMRLETYQKKIYGDAMKTCALNISTEQHISVAVKEDV